MNKENERKIHNCPNCGAPLNTHGDCEYCGSRRLPAEESEIVITSDSIRISYGRRP